MNTQRRLFPLLTLSLVFLGALVPTLAQSDQPKIAEPNYEAVLHVLSASDQAGSGAALPPTLSAVAKQVRGEFGASNLKLINTYLGRLSSTGNIEYKGVSNSYGTEPESGSPSFLDWRLGGLRPLQNAAGQDVYTFQNFRFGARIPIKVASFRDEAGKSPVINYEMIGLTLDRFSLRESTPTLLGTLTQPKTDGTLFLVLTVRNADK